MGAHQAEPFHLLIECRPIDPKLLGRCVPIPTQLLERLQDDLPLGKFEGFFQGAPAAAFG
jgi:hypothetical protein